MSRRLPDTLVVDIVERTPAAIWQNHGKLTLIDKDGVELAPVPVDKMPDLPLADRPGRQSSATAQLDRAARGGAAAQADCSPARPGSAIAAGTSTSSRARR